MNNNALRAAIQQQTQMRSYAAQPKSRVSSIPAPTGGINTIDSFDGMPPTDAVGMVNILPGFGGVNVRNGTKQRYLGIGSGDVLTIAEYFSGTNRKMLASSQTNIYDAAKVPPYPVNAVRLGKPSAYYTRGAAVTGLSDAKTGSISFWLVLDSSIAGSAVIFSDQDSSAGGIGLQVYYDNNSKIHIIGKNSAGTTILDINNTTAITNTISWYHILASWDLAAGTTNFYINNSSDKTQTTATNDTIDYTKTNCSIGGDTAGFSRLDGSISEFWHTNTYIDFSSAPNRAKFIDSNGLPVSLGTDGSTPTGTAAKVYLNGTYITFGTNAGTGGNFTLTAGNVHAASTSPTSIALSLLGSMTSGRWQTANFMSNMLWVNGQDTPQVFGGSAFTSWTGSCSGMTATSVIGCNVYRNRMYVWMANDSNFFYGATQTIGGTYVKFQLGDVANHGGNIVAIRTLSHDGGNGPTDYLATFMSSGDVIVYSGDPASTFTLVGIYRIPPPMGIRSIIKFGGDILIQTKNDYVLFSQVLSGVYKNPSKISGSLQTAANNYSSNNGWQLLYWPDGGLVIGNIPVTSTNFDQHVLNTLTGAWTTYDALNARCWGLYNGNLYFGVGDGSIYQAETGTDDNGTAISYDVQQAWNDAGYYGRKQVTSFRPVFTSVGTLTYNAGIAYDYGVVNVSQTSTQASVGAAWDSSAWDTTDWSPEVQLKQSWMGASGIGYKTSIRLTGSVTGQTVTWYRTDFNSTPAGAI